ncbi:MAG: hypothetical protein ACK4MG_16545 [Aquabacterium sp.]
MKKYTLSCLLASMALLSFTGPAGAQNVGVSVSINQPGFYGRVDIGDTRPALIYAQPVIIAPGPVGVVQRPIYMRVPPGHSKNWGRYCGQYNACGQPVYFVRDGGSPPPRKHKHKGGHDHDHGHDHHGHDHDDHPGKGHGKGRGH